MVQNAISFIFQVYGNVTLCIHFFLDVCVTVSQYSVSFNICRELVDNLPYFINYFDFSICNNMIKSPTIIFLRDRPPQKV